MKKEKTVILFTGSYPYSAKAEDTFLDPEIKCLASAFDRFIIIPSTLEGRRQDIPSQIEVEETYVSYCRSQEKIVIWFLVFTSNLFYREIFSKPSILLHRDLLKRLISFIGLVIKTKEWTINLIKKRKIDTGNTIFYTYWLNHITASIGLLKKKYPRIKLISRAHGIDLYEERSNFSYIPCRYETLQMLDNLFLISEHGKNYIFHRYPAFRYRYTVSKLGVNCPGFLTNDSQDGTFRMLSCSFVLPVKKIDLLCNGIVELARLRPNQEFEWYHIGDGPLRTDIEKETKRLMLDNVKAHFLGYLSNTKVISFYKDTPIDVFINVSSYEGIPVTIMEAQSCGIPVIATAVGDIPEIVSDNVGKLLDRNPTPQKIAMAICSILDTPELAKEKRKASKINWQNNYNADKNFSDFTNRLKSILNDI